MNFFLKIQGFQMITWLVRKFYGPSFRIVDLDDYVTIVRGHEVGFMAHGLEVPITHACTLECLEVYRHGVLIKYTQFLRYYICGDVVRATL